MQKEYDFSNAELVIPPKDPNKTRICIRLDTKVLNWFRQRVHEAGGGNYQTMINDALEEFINQRSMYANIMESDLIKTTPILSGSVTISTEIVHSARMDVIMDQQVYLMGISSTFVTPKKEKDERKKYSLAA